MKIKKVVYLTQTPFSKRDNDRFGVDVFLNHGVEVVVLDVTAYMDSQVAKEYILDSKHDYGYVIKCSDYFEIKTFILSTTLNTIFISFIGESSVKSLRILNLLYNNKKEFGIILSGSLPSISNNNNILNRLKLLNLKNIKRLLGKAFYLMFFNKFNYSFIIASGENSYKIIKNKYTNSSVIDGHAFDYDLYLKEQNNIDLFQKKDYAVFLDEFFPFHPDYIRHGIDYSHFAKTYYKKLAYFFDYIENTFDLDIVISAHPRSYYNQLPNYWNGRKVILGNTINLVKNSKICLLHASTSINFAILYNKPLIFLTMHEIKSSNVQVLLEAMANELSSAIVDLDDFDKNEVKIKYNKEQYNIYKNKYIKRDINLDLNNWELLYDYFYNCKQRRNKYK